MKRPAPREDRRGPTSFWRHDPDLVFDELGLNPGDAFLDLGSGPGDYSLTAAVEVGAAGIVYAVDKWDAAIEQLECLAAEKELANIKGLVANFTESLPLGDQCVDVCLLATVLYLIHRADDRHKLFKEIRRVLKPGGRLAVIEFKKEERNFGPPPEVSLSPEETEALVAPLGFKKHRYADLGYNYLIQFTA